jgi:hypothetical protein
VSVGSAVPAGAQVGPSGQLSGGVPAGAGQVTAGELAASDTSPSVGQSDPPVAGGQSAETATEQDVPAAAPEQPARPARRAGGGRSRRSSVPSWDEIMFGNSRQPE